MTVQDFIVISGSAPQAGSEAASGVGGDSGESGRPPAPAPSLSDEERRELETQLERLRQEHRDLDAAIEALNIAPGRDLLQVQRLKKRKLVLRDKIIQTEDQLTPDIIA